MERYKLMWNVFRNSNVYKNQRTYLLKYKHDGALNEIDNESKLGKPLKLLIYDIPRFTSTLFVMLYLMFALSYRESLVTFLIVYLSLLAACYLLLPLIIIPRAYKNYLTN